MKIRIPFLSALDDVTEKLFDAILSEGENSTITVFDKDGRQLNKITILRRKKR